MDVDDVFIDFEMLRTPFEMKEYFELIYDITTKNEELKELARLKRGKYKQFLEEFYPLYLFSQSAYCDDQSRMKIILGNQQYDSVIINPDGSEEKYEFTSYIDGEWDFQDAKRLNERGYGDFRIQNAISLEDRDKDYLLKIMDNVIKKSKKDYSQVNIIFIVNTFDYFEIFKRDSNNFIDFLKEEIIKVELRAKKVYLLIKNNQTIGDIDKNIYLL